MKPLFLYLKYEYFDLVRRKKKMIEYREYKPYWIKRIKNQDEVIFANACKKYGIRLKAKIISIDVVPYIDLPPYVRRYFMNSPYKKFFAIKFKLIENKRN